MRGRKPTPSHLRGLKGNQGKRASKPEPPVVVGLPDPPAHLSEVAKAQWKDLGARLVEARLMTDIDGGQLALYCTAWARWVEAEEQLRAHGAVIVSPNGWPVQSPYLSIANKAMEQMQRALLEFGMSPSSRARVSASSTKAGATPKARLEALVGGKRA